MGARVGHLVIATVAQLDVAVAGLVRGESDGRHGLLGRPGVPGHEAGQDRKCSGGEDPGAYLGAAEHALEPGRHRRAELAAARDRHEDLGKAVWGENERRADSEDRQCSQGSDQHCHPDRQQDGSVSESARLRRVAQPLGRADEGLARADFGSECPCPREDVPGRREESRGRPDRPAQLVPDCDAQSWTQAVCRDPRSDKTAHESRPGEHEAAGRDREVDRPQWGCPPSGKQRGPREAENGEQGKRPGQDLDEVGVADGRCAEALPAEVGQRDIESVGQGSSGVWCDRR